MILITGAGLSGAVLARKYAEAGKKVLVVEKRNHIGGNCYDYINRDGILVPKYGPHFFHTNMDTVIEFVSRFSEWILYEHRVLSYVDGKLVPVPVNINTVNTLFDLDIKSEREMIAWLDENTIKTEKPANSEESAISRVGPVLYEKMFKSYTKKQWDLYPHELDAQVMNRIPVRTNYEDRYFTDKWQTMPKNGYTVFFENMLDHANIEIELNSNFLEDRKYAGRFEKHFFTGRIDSYFRHLGLPELQYRSLHFEFETLDKEWHQKTATINYPNDFEYTRITEPKHSTDQKHQKTTIIREYPSWEGDPYYPVLNDGNKALYQKYETVAKEVQKDGVHFVGRLANYKYFNMDMAVANALNVYGEVEG